MNLFIQKHRINETIKSKNSSVFLSFKIVIIGKKEILSLIWNLFTSFSNRNKHDLFNFVKEKNPKSQTYYFQNVVYIQTQW